MIYEHLYNMFQSFRLGVSMNGLAFPMAEHLAEPRITHFANPSFNDANNRNASSIIQKMPRLKFDLPECKYPLAQFFHMDRHLLYPPTNREIKKSDPCVIKAIDGLEKRKVVAAPLHYLPQFSTWYAWGDHPLDSDILNDILEVLRENDHEQQLQNIVENRGLGNAVELTKALYQRWYNGERIPDFNLDADRGLGYLCWTQVDTPNTPEAPKEIIVKTNPAATIDLIFLHQ